MVSASSLSTALAWLDAVTSRDTERVIELSDPEIEIAGPRGIAKGRQVLREWMESVWLELETLRTFAKDDAVVVGQHAVWRDVETGDVIGEREAASQFRVVDGRIAFYARHDALGDALAAAGLEEKDAYSERK